MAFITHCQQSGTKVKKNLIKIWSFRCSQFLSAILSSKSIFIRCNFFRQWNWIRWTIFFGWNTMSALQVNKRPFSIATSTIRRRYFCVDVIENINNSSNLELKRYVFSLSVFVRFSTLRNVFKTSSTNMPDAVQFGGHLFTASAC